ncbi:Catalase [Dactylellina cionopaga]|nr:Catalase [Dactylellina cionopaga]
MQPDEADALILGFDPFDVTKVWPRKQFPMHEFGKLVLNKNPENYHRDVEQSAFSPGSLVPGIEPSPDMLLQFRTFFYRDAQYHRLGVNLHQVPVNCPFMASSYASISYDGPLRSDANTAGIPHYAPNSYVDKFSPDKAECPVVVSDNILSRQSHHFHEGNPSEYDQPRELYQRVMSSDARARLHANTADYLKWANPDIQQAYLAQCWAISPDYAKGIYNALPEKKIGFEAVEISGKDAASKGKCKKFMPKDNNHRLIGKAVSLQGFEE